jgi:hypothetical protein
MEIGAGFPLKRKIVSRPRWPTLNVGQVLLQLTRLHRNSHKPGQILVREDSWIVSPCSTYLTEVLAAENWSFVMTKPGCQW